MTTMISLSGERTWICDQTRRTIAQAATLQPGDCIGWTENGTKTCRTVTRTMPYDDIRIVGDTPALVARIAVATRTAGGPLVVFCFDAADNISITRPARIPETRESR
jgi:hypothetical protein